LHAVGASVDTLHLYFGINQYKLTDKHKLQIKSAIDSSRSDQHIIVNGFCDYLGSKAYNQPLSERRANEVGNFIGGSNPHVSITVAGKGQIPEPGAKSPYGEPHNRRVDIIFITQPGKLPTRADSLSARFSKKIDSLAGLEVGKSLPLEELTFEPGRHILRPEARPLLKLLLKVITDNKNLVFEIRGHVCCEDYGNDGVDIDQGTRNLSVNRAREIYYYFLENGIDKSRMTYTGVGSSQPKVYPEVTERDRQLNRRVEIVVLKK
jgi:outer membrane protein OmpA-like peptidoglycan-associated protein